MLRAACRLLLAFVLVDIYSVGYVQALTNGAPLARVARRTLLTSTPPLVLTPKYNYLSKLSNIGSSVGSREIVTKLRSSPIENISNHTESSIVKRWDKYFEKFQDKFMGSVYGREKPADARLHKKLDREFVGVALPAFFSLAADPLASFVDGCYVGRLSVNEQAGMGMAINTQVSFTTLISCIHQE